MRIFWHPDGLQIVPEDEREYDLLRAIAGCSAGKQAEVHLHMTERNSPSGNRLFQLRSASDQNHPINSDRKSNREENVVSINERSKDQPGRAAQSNRRSDL
jgi:hypothetical protein